VRGDPPGFRKMITCSEGTDFPMKSCLDEISGSVLFLTIPFITKDSTSPLSQDPNQVSNLFFTPSSLRAAIIKIFEKS